MFTAEEAREAVKAHEAKEIEAVNMLAQTLVRKIEQGIIQNATNGRNSSVYHMETTYMFRPQDVKEACVKSLIEAGYKVEVNNQTFHIHW